MGSTLRSKCRPLGRRDSQKVADGNCMVSRCMILCILAACKACWWVLEQPASSIMEYHPSFQRMLRLLGGTRRMMLCMSNYGGQTRKATVLYSSHGEIDDLLDEATEPVQSSGPPPEMTIRYQNQKGEWRFGRAMSKTRTKNARAVKRAARRFLRKALDTENTLDSAVASNISSLPRCLAHFVMAKPAPKPPRCRVTFKSPPAASVAKSGKTKKEKKVPKCMDPRFQKAPKNKAPVKEEKHESKVARKDNRPKKDPKVKEVTKEEKQKRCRESSQQSPAARPSALRNGGKAAAASKSNAAKNEKDLKDKKEVSMGKDKKTKVDKHVMSSMQALKRKLEEQRKVEEEESDASSGEESDDSINEQLEKLIKQKNGKASGKASAPELEEEADSQSASEAEEDHGGTDSEEEEDDEANEEGEDESEPESDDKSQSASGDEGSDDEAEEEEKESDKSERKKCGANETAIVPVRNSVTHKKEYDTFLRQIQNKKLFPVDMSSYVTKCKNDLFCAWLDAGKNWDNARLIMQRTHSNEQESLSGWIAKRGKELVEMYGEEKGRSLMVRRQQEGLFYNSEDFPDDELERFYYMRKPKEMNRRQTIRDSTIIDGEASLDNDMLKAHTDETDGMMRAGAMPAGHAETAAGQKALHDALNESVQAAPKKKAKKTEEASVPVAPKTIIDKAKDLMQEVLDESVAARRKGMALGAVSYAGELSTQLITYASTMEKRYASLQQAVSKQVDDHSFFDSLFKKIEKERKWFPNAEAAAGSILSGIKRANKPKKEKGPKKGETSKGKEVKK
ncbi:Uncharacterized protein SCF082_LOCUS15391 [Durusdinium trenchii]|uniref:Uncharacterized protein n=1 Tax=Durusdinium trenchii TaxID=1381693 RepID=A0ABP0K432_9DINO